MIFKKKENWKYDLKIYLSIITGKLKNLTKSSTRSKIKITLLVSFVIVFFLIKYISWLVSFEYVYKYPEQCTAYPTSFIKKLNEIPQSYEDIETQLKLLNISRNDILFGQTGKSNSFYLNYYAATLIFIIFIFKAISRSKKKLAIIIPYRDREKNLKIFLHYMHLFLYHQRNAYQIFLIEPIEEAIFNRGLLLNIGYLEALKLTDFDCFMLHDVDMIPENLANIYECNTSFPIQMATSVSIYKYQ